MSGASTRPDNRQARRYWRDKAPHWNRTADAIADLADRLNQPLLDAAEVCEGHRVLDLASGTGEPALSASRRVGPAGRVVATDLVAEMLVGAERRAAAAGLENMEFRVADMEALPFEDASFDRVTCRFGIMFAGAPERALAEALRVLKPGRRAAFLVWGPREDSTLFRVLKAAGERVLGRESGWDMETQFRFGGAGSLAGLMDVAGFRDAEEREIRFAPKVPADLPFWRPQVAMTFGSVAADAPADLREALDAAIAAALAPYVRDGKYHLTLHARIAVGDAPA